MLALRITLLALIFGFISIPLSAQGPPRRSAYVSECGSGVDWAEDYEEALSLAKKLKKPIFWYVPTAMRTPMDRRQELYWNMMAGPFSDPEVVNYINQRYVPLKIGFRSLIRRGKTLKIADKKLAEKYELIQGKFVEPGFVLLDKKGKLIHTVDRFLLFQRTWFLQRLESIAKKNTKALNYKAKDNAKSKLPMHDVDSARAAIGTGDVASAAKTLGLIPGSDDRYAESEWLLGVCHHMQNKTTAGNKVWRALAASHSESIWGQKAKTELDGWGPFMNGFESYRDFPTRVMAHKEMRHSRVPGTAEDQGQMVARGIIRLLDLQREDGSWSDSRYDFGGIDSLPNVHVAVTAIAARGLLDWRTSGPKDRIEKALQRAVVYLSDDTHLNPKDKDELIWAYVYRINFFSRLLELDPQQKAKVMPTLQRLVTDMEKLQMQSGAFRHEYAAAFTSASAMHSLYVAADAGANVSMPKLKAATKAVLGARVEKSGAFGYGMRNRGGVEQAGGRMPLCELALYLGGASSSKKLSGAVAEAFKQHGNFETARNYDDHMRSLYAIGGFFFWYDMHGRAEAINRLSGKKAGKWREAVRKIVFSTNEADGGWIDSHELGKSYGTGMALTVLRLMQDLKQ